jgi:tetratricopeptide (TPR) repeat protein
MGAGGCFDASLLMQLGRFAEAEQQFEQAVASEKQPKLSALAHVMFGELLLELRRYPQAQEHFDAAVSLWPERGATYRDIAELCLRRGDKPSDALRWARLAVETERAGAGVTPETKKANLSCDLATLAWAVAADSRDAAEVRRLYAEALTLSADNPVTSTAQMHCHFGQAYTALDDSAASSQQFEQAARVDPHGLWGRTAQTMATGVRQCQ